MTLTELLKTAAAGSLYYHPEGGVAYFNGRTLCWRTLVKHESNLIPVSREMADGWQDVREFGSVLLVFPEETATSYLVLDKDTERMIGIIQWDDESKQWCFRCASTLDLFTEAMLLCLQEAIKYVEDYEND